MSTVPNNAKAKGSFQAMGLDMNLIKGLNRIGYTMPTPVQRKALPIALAGIDLVCMSRTGSGKTCVFVLPMIQTLKAHSSSGGVRAVILSPTRELALQTWKVAKDMAKFTDLKVASIVGGDSIDGQFDQLAGNPDMIVATPGRLMHHLREISTFKLKHCKYLVFDEADRLFEMGFAEQLNEIVRECPLERQTLLFSATMPKQLVQFSRAGLRDPQFIRLDAEASLSAELRIAFFTMRSNEKLAALLYIMRKIIPKDQLTIIFTATKHHTEFLHFLFEKVGLSSTLVYGSMDQESRTNNLKKFRHGDVKNLIVTDVAARGIDIPLLNNVINFHFVSSPKLFVHRCGRAARQGRIGYALSLVDSEELAYMMDVRTYLDISEKNDEEEGDSGNNNNNNNIDGDNDNTANSNNSNNHNNSNNSSNNSNLTTNGYTLETMTPTMIHTGIFPQDVLDEENDYLRQRLNDDFTLFKLFQVSENGFLQYKKTRPEATHDGVKKAKALVKSKQDKKLHPLIIGMDPKKCNAKVIEKQNFVKALQAFRPQFTVLETAGIGSSVNKRGAGRLETSVSSTATNLVNSGLTSTNARIKNESVEIMSNFRKSVTRSLDRNKQHYQTKDALLLESGNKNNNSSSKSNTLTPEADDENNDNVDEDDGDDNDEYDGGKNSNDDEEDDDYTKPSRVQKTSTIKNKNTSSSNNNSNSTSTSTTTSTIKHQPRLSKADRKKVKNQHMIPEELQNYLFQKQQNQLLLSHSTNHSNNSNNNHSSTYGEEEHYSNEDDKANELKYRDNQYFMSYGGVHESSRQDYVENASQPQSALRSSEAMGASLLEASIMDLTPDNSMDINRNKKLLRWDAKKRKFVKQTLNEMAKSKKIRTETGVVVSNNKPQGEMYEKWKKKRKMEINSNGGNGDGSGSSSSSSSIYDYSSSSPSSSSTDNRAGRYNSNNKNSGGSRSRESSNDSRGSSGGGGGRRGSSAGGSNTGSSPNFKFNTKVKSELRDAGAIRKIKDGRDKMKVKNMAKGKRKSVMDKRKKRK